MNRADKPESPMGHRFSNTKERKSLLTERVEESKLNRESRD
jgi:hypothetical protein